MFFAVLMFILYISGFGVISQEVLSTYQHVMENITWELLPSQVLGLDV